ncbi:DUF5916 domain-containing protein [Flavobacterium taihuense]|uniref:Carbohydrate binding family 9 domain-containing protein n=1 Tax=Flavobacterium taihuense TaxID=2857508 RepID=A0ABS6XSQ7_9FLAO|nr:DUF5916 domain-containing protein [Flavobacterium taihuense]MBW4359684.1 carbohydrate binding family 9 domain-containing protein [Flavobacterium taihuense]
MTNIKNILVFFIILCSSILYGQKKTLNTKSITSKISIDGKITEDIWNSTEIASDFVMYQPDNGKPISENKKTEVKIIYDNDAIYIAAIMHDEDPSKIKKEITNRDKFGVTDYFSVFINGFNDGQQDFRFYVTAAGVQIDCISTEGYNDFSWDAIWDSKTTLTDQGWVVEMKIPYAAIRFPNSKKQTWGINFLRNIERDVQVYSWNRIDTKIGAELTQNGILEGIENIKTPTRLFFIPYASFYNQKDDFQSDNTFKGGMDIKYGINDAFTLDAILVPDFGQTKFDNAILNLEPFEQQLNENRPFFTEGTELFSKGNLFYSRRIGGFPSGDPIVGENEEITNYPSNVDLLNAIKISGRTKKGLGIGLLNAITEKTYATIKDTVTLTTRKEVIEPLANYNILVLDQRFNKNSSVTFINTNTTRNGDFRDANVTGLLFDLNTKKNSYNLNGDFKYSTINTAEDYNGYKTSLGFKKTSGKIRYEVSGKYISEDYDVNDLGIIFYTNYHAAYANVSYRILNPTSIFNTFKIIEEANLEIQNTTGKIQEDYLKTTIGAKSKKNTYYEFSLLYAPKETFDFYQPLEYGRYVYVPKRISSYFGFELNQNHDFTVDATVSTAQYDEENRQTYGIYINPKYRFNNQFSLEYAFEYLTKRNDRGRIGYDTNGIVFAERNRETLQNTLTGKFALTNRMALNLDVRYYWSYSENHEFFTLQDDGYLSPYPSYNLNRNRNYNSWNFDLSYSWWFAPGSQIYILYRNYGLEDTRLVEKDLSTNLKNIFDSNLTNIFSISIRYYIDYNVVKNKF